MTTDAATTDIAFGAAARSSPLTATVRWRMLGYIGLLLILLSFGSPSGGLIGLPITFFLKNKLHLKAHDVANFGLISHLPLYVGFLFGFARDQWNPLGLRDRGFLIVFGALTAAIYLAFAFIPPTYGALLAAVLLSSTSFLFLGGALRGLTSTLGQQNLMSGQMSAAWHIFEGVPAIVAMLSGGALSTLLERDEAAHGPRTLFLLGAALMLATCAYGLWRPRSVYENIHYERLTSSTPLQDLKRLLAHKPIYPALLIWFLWNFDLGSRTPLQFFMQNTLHATDTQWGQFHAILIASFLPTFLLYAMLCRRVPLKTLLLWGTIAAIPQFVPLLFIHSVNGALIAAIPMGLVGGVATAAYFDLLIRSCPSGLQGTLQMAAAAIFAINLRFGDVLGTYLYDYFGNFTVCVTAVTAVYALILPALWMIPKGLTATADGQAPAG